MQKRNFSNKIIRRDCTNHEKKFQKYTPYTPYFIVDSVSRLDSNNLYDTVMKLVSYG